MWRWARRARRCWRARRRARLKKLVLFYTQPGDAGLAALARGAWPALEVLGVSGNDLSAPLALEDARRWAPALAELFVDGV